MGGEGLAAARLSCRYRWPQYLLDRGGAGAGTNTGTGTFLLRWRFAGSSHTSGRITNWEP